jgi:hypothetical protein
MQKFIRTTVIAAGFSLSLTLLSIAGTQTAHVGAGASLLAEGPALPYPKLPPPPPKDIASATVLMGPALPYPKLPPPPKDVASAAMLMGPALPYPKLPPPPKDVAAVQTFA